MKTLTLTTTLFSLLITLANYSQTQPKKENITPEQLSTWTTLDSGKTTINEGTTIIEETEGADGYFLVSPKSYEGDLILNYKVKALSESAVLIVLFSASDYGMSQGVTLPPEGTKGRGFWTWRTHLEHYNLTFNNASHSTKPFFFKNETPNKRGFYQNKADNIMDVGEWYDVEVGKKGNRLWFKLNDDIIFEQNDYEPLAGGHLIFRISGTTGENVILAKAAIKDLIITHE